MNAQLISAVADVMESQARLLRLLGAADIAMPNRLVAPGETRSWWKRQKEKDTASLAAKRDLLAEAIHEAAKTAPSTNIDTTITEAEAVKIADTIAPAIPLKRMPTPPRKAAPVKPAVPGFRGMGDITVGDFTFKTTGRFAAVIGSLLTAPKSIMDLIGEGHGSTDGGIRATVYQTNKILRDATKDEWVIRSEPGAHLGALGNAPGLWRLVKRSDVASEPKPEPIKSEAVVTVEAAPMPNEVKALCAPDPAPLLEPAPKPEISSPAPVARRGATGAQAEAAAAVSKAKHTPLPIPDGHLCSVSMDDGMVHTKQGSYPLAGAQKIGRTLKLLANGDMFDLKVIAQRCGWMNADAARTGMEMEQRRLKEHGLTLYIDKINARLRRIEP